MLQPVWWQVLQTTISHSSRRITSDATVGVACYTNTHWVVPPTRRYTAPCRRALVTDTLATSTTMMNTSDGVERLGAHTTYGDVFIWCPVIRTSSVTQHGFKKAKQMNIHSRHSLRNRASYFSHLNAFICCHTSASKKCSKTHRTCNATEVSGCVSRRRYQYRDRLTVLVSKVIRELHYR